jgi:hypothetical protein
MSSFTNVWVPEESREPLKEAIKHYRFESASSFFRICALTLLEHYKSKDELPTPFRFVTTKTKTNK